MKQHLLYKIFISLVFVVIIITISFWPDNSEQLARKCFSNHVNIEEKNIELLQDIMIASKKPNLGKSIFFHETSCANGIVTLNARYKQVYRKLRTFKQFYLFYFRQGCAIESAGKRNIIIFIDSVQI